MEDRALSEELERRVGAQEECLSARHLAILTGRSVADARAEIRDRASAKAVAISGISQESGCRTFRLALEHDAEHLQRSLENTFAQPFAALPECINNASSLAQALSAEAASVSDRLASGDASCLEHIARCGACMSPCNPSKPSHQPTPTPALQRQQQQQQQRPSLFETKEERKLTENDSKDVSSRGNTAQHSKFGNENQQQQQQKSSKPQPKQGSQKSAAKDKMFSMFNNAPKKSEKSKDNGTSDAQAESGKHAAGKRGASKGASGKQEKQQPRNASSKQEETLPPKAARKVQRLEDSDEESEDEAEPAVDELEAKPLANRADDPKYNEQLGQQQRELEEEQRKQEEDERKEEERRQGALEGYAKQGASLNGKGLQKTTRTFINDQGEEVTETVWESVDGEEKQNQNRREESLREQKKRKQGEGKQEQEQEQKAKKTGKAGGQASMKSFVDRRG